MKGHKYDKCHKPPSWAGILRTPESIARVVESLAVRGVRGGCHRCGATYDALLFGITTEQVVWRVAGCTRCRLALGATCLIVPAYRTVAQTSQERDLQAFIDAVVDDWQPGREFLL